MMLLNESLLSWSTANKCGQKELTNIISKEGKYFFCKRNNEDIDFNDIDFNDIEYL